MGLTRVQGAMRVGDQVFDAIHDGIVNGELPAGRRLQIRQLADEIGTSVMPVREAIKRLEQLGLVESAPYRGAAVRSFTSEELGHIYDVRRLLECEAARLGAPQVDAAGERALGRLRAASLRALERRDAVAYIEADESFLRRVYEAAGNPVLTECIDTQWRLCRSYKILGVRRELDHGVAEELLDHQDRLIRAVEGHDGAAAEAVTLAALEAAASRIDAAMSAGGVAD